MGEQKATALWTKFHVLRAAILGAIEAGVSDNDPRMLQARHQQRMIAEELVRIGAAKGIAFEHEGDYHREQKGMAARFGKQKEQKVEAPRDQVVKMKPLRFQGRSGDLMAIAPPPSQVVGVEALRMEGKASSVLNRNLSALEGTLGIDYAIAKDPDSGIVFYVPLTGGNDG